MSIESMIAGWMDECVLLFVPDNSPIRKTQSWTKSGNQDVPHVCTWITILHSSSSPPSSSCCHFYHENYILSFFKWKFWKFLFSKLFYHLSNEILSLPSICSHSSMYFVHTTSLTPQNESLKKIVLWPHFTERKLTQWRR